MFTLRHNSTCAFLVSTPASKSEAADEQPERPRLRHEPHDPRELRQSHDPENLGGNFRRDRLRREGVKLERYCPILFQEFHLMIFQKKIRLVQIGV